METECSGRYSDTGSDRPIIAILGDIFGDLEDVGLGHL